MNKKITPELLYKMITKREQSYNDFKNEHGTYNLGYVHALIEVIDLIKSK